MDQATLPAIEAPDAKVRAILAVLDKMLQETWSQLDGYPGWQNVILQIGMGFAAALESEE